MTTELVAGLVILILVVVFGYDRTRLARKVGALKEENDANSAKAEQYKDALAILVSADPTLDELERLSNAAVAAASQPYLPGMEPGGAPGIPGSGADRKKRKGRG